MDRSSRFILRKLIIDFTCLFIVGISVLIFFLYGKPYERGFYCNDESLYYPYISSTITSPMLYIMGLALPIGTILVGEYMHSRNSGGESSRIFLGYPIPPWVWASYQKIGIFGFGAACNLLITDIAKYTIGRLRPHFMQICVPDVDCSLPENHHRYIQKFNCTATNVSARILKEIRLSFPSGHSSFSAYTMLYLVLYLQLRVSWQGSKLLRHFLQLICLLMAWFTAMTRISNYKHHWSDVLAGCCIGTVVALVVAFGIADMFKERRQTENRNNEKFRSTEYEVELGAESGTHQVNNGTVNRVC